MRHSLTPGSKEIPRTWQQASALLRRGPDTWENSLAAPAGTRSPTGNAQALATSLVPVAPHTLLEEH